MRKIFSSANTAHLKPLVLSHWSERPMCEIPKSDVLKTRVILFAKVVQGGYSLQHRSNEDLINLKSILNGLPW